jgi:hypothetical protein
MTSKSDQKTDPKICYIVGHKTYHLYDVFSSPLSAVRRFWTSFQECGGPERGIGMAYLPLQPKINTLLQKFRDGTLKDSELIAMVDDKDNIHYTTFRDLLYVTEHLIQCHPIQP